MIALAPPHGPSSHVGRSERTHRSVSSSRTQEVRRAPVTTPSATTTTTHSTSTTTEPTTTATPAAVPTPAAATVAPAATPNVPAATATNRPTVARMQRLADGSLDLGSYPSTDLLRLLAALLTQITTENDKLRPQSTPHTPLTPPSESPDTRSPVWSKLTSASRNALVTPAASLAFHARNIPSISIEQYLLRILKYCPTTNEVFLGLIVYFDRMSRLATDCALPHSPSPHRTFTIDSYNIHRLLIAGVTVASKFFSDVFYTNSRYAKVGGLPQTELNQLELHFLLLNDFRLSIPIDEMQRYAQQLLRYSAGMSPEDAFAPSATAPPAATPAPPSPHTPVAPPTVHHQSQPQPQPQPQPDPEPHRPAHLQLQARSNIPTPTGTSPGHLSTSFSTNSFPKTSHHDAEAHRRC
ncbi:PHO85 cyclin-7 AltName: Full=PHO85-associated protein 1 [Rhizoctonia solani AG-1 IB]|uniref:PCL7 protein n=1 Tax=Thanatephorus cucumeris (strain AG1-IB / isolate 7/3/14) TaxID=1108050 RepID=M5BKG6_THACB|nr:PHO85 cyclin-7 AltName: Full=PHO85-associated protein 1 [Rhizoctonia solani AG-1 IB]